MTWTSPELDIFITTTPRRELRTGPGQSAPGRVTALEVASAPRVSSLVKCIECSLSARTLVQDLETLSASFDAPFVRRGQGRGHWRARYVHVFSRAPGWLPRSHRAAGGNGPRAVAIHGQSIDGTDKCPGPKCSECARSSIPPCTLRRPCGCLSIETTGACMPAHHGGMHSTPGPLELLAALARGSRPAEAPPQPS